MKIAVVFDGLRVGGIERVGLNYIKMFIEKGYKVTLFNLIPSLNEFESEVNEKCDVERFLFPRWLAPERYAATLKKRWWGKYVYPLAFILCSVLVFLYTIVLRITKKSLRNTYDITIAFSGHMNDLTVVSNSIVKGKKKIAWLHGALYGYAIISPGFLRLYSKIKNLISLSDSCDAEMYEFMKENRINKKTIYNPIYIQDKAVDESIVDDLKNKYGDFCLMVGRLANDKDQVTAIKAIKVLNQKYNLNKVLVLVGDGPNRKNLEKFIEDEQMRNNVFLAGTRNDVQNFYRAATVYVHSSPLEGLPTVLLEAMHYGLPIASTDSIPGVREILGNDKCGLISPVFDETSLADNIYRLYTNNGLKGSLVKEGKARFLDFTPITINKSIESYFENLS